MPAPLIVAGVAAGSTWIASSVLNAMNLKDDNAQASVYTFKGKDGKQTEIPAAAVAAGAGLLTLLVTPAGLIGAMGAGLMVGGLSAMTTTAQVRGAAEAAAKQLEVGGGDTPDWLFDLARPYMTSER